MLATSRGCGLSTAEIEIPGSPPSRSLIPRVPTDLAPPRRLLEKLDTDAPLVFVRGPRGAGKTTVLAHWALAWHGSGSPGALVWVSLDPDADRGLWSQVAHGLASTGVVVERGPDWHLAEAVRAALHRSRQPVVLVLDSYECVSDRALDAEVASLVRRCRNLRVVIGSRRRSGLESPADTGFDVTRIGPEELYLTPEEVHTAALRMGLPAAAFPGHLHQQSAGHPGLLRRVALAQLDGANPARTPGIPQRLLACYVEDSLTHVVDAGVSTPVLLSLALPTRLTPEVVGVLVPDRDAGAVLSGIEESGLVSQDLAEGSEGLRWLPAIREVMVKELVRCFPGQAQRAHGQLARWFADHGDPGSALLHAHRGRHHALVCDLLRRCWFGLLHSDAEVTHTVVEALPAHEVSGQPHLGMLRDLLIGTGAPGQHLLSFLPERNDDLRDLGARPGVRPALDLCLLRLLALRRRGQLADAAALAARVETLVEAAAEFQQHEVGDLLAPLRLETGTIRLLGADLSGSQHGLTRAYQNADRSAHPATRRSAAERLALTDALRGNFHRSEEWLRRAGSCRDGRRAGIHANRVVRYSARLIVAAGRLDEDEASLARVALLRDPDSSRDMWAFEAYAHAEYALVWGDPIVALQRLRSERLAHQQHGGSPPVAQRLLPAAEAELLMAAGRGDDARSVLRQVVQAHPLVEAAAARLAVLSGHPQKALAICARLRWSPDLSPRVARELWSIQVVAHARLGDLRAARDSAVQLTRDYRCEQSLRAFSRIPSELLRRLSLDLTGGAEVLAQLRTRQARPTFPERLELVCLTARERVVLRHLAEDRSVKEIAERLCVSANTVKSQLRSAYRKLDASTRSQAVARAAEYGLLDARGAHPR